MINKRFEVVEDMDFDIDYIEIANYFMDIINDIHKIQNKITKWKWRDEPQPSEELLKKAKEDYSSYYWSFDRAYDRAKDVIDLIEFKNETDFAYFALSNLNNTKARIEGFLKDALLEYPNYNLNKYDNILKDYYNKMDSYEDAVMKYTNIDYIRTNVNLGLCHDIDHQYDLLSAKYFDGIREENYKILDEIVALVKQLYGFKPPTDKKDTFIRYDRWNDE